MLSVMVTESIFVAEKSKSFYVLLARQERQALYKLSDLRRRDARDQAAVLIRVQLEALGLLRDSVAQAVPV